MGKQVVRVDDLRLLKIAGEYRVIAVETGPLAKFRRMGCQGIGKFIYKVTIKITKIESLCGMMLSHWK